MKKLKKMGEPCPDCECRALTLISREHNIDGIIYTDQYIFCQMCEYTAPYKKKNSHERINLSED